MEELKPFEDKIRRQYSGMTRSQIKLSHYILENSSAMPFFSSAQLAQKVGVSEATVNRFCLAIGYSGYLDFQRDMRRWAQVRALERFFLGYRDRRIRRQLRQLGL